MTPFVSQNIRHVGRNRLIAAALLLLVGCSLSVWIVGNGLLSALLGFAVTATSETLDAEIIAQRETLLGAHLSLQKIELTMGAGEYTDPEVRLFDIDETPLWYYLVTELSDGRVLFLIVDRKTWETVSHSPRHTFVGVMQTPPLLFEHFLLQEAHDLDIPAEAYRSNFTTYHLDTMHSGTISRIVVLTVTLGSLVWGFLFLWTGLRWLLEPGSHPIWQLLASWSEAEQAATLIQQEVDSGKVSYYTYWKQYLLLTSGWLFQGNAFTLWIFRASDMVWAYPSIRFHDFTHMTVDFSRVNLYFKTRQIRCWMKMDRCESLLLDLKKRYPSSTYGYTMETAQRWHQSRLSSSNQV